MNCPQRDARSLLARFAERGVVLTVECVREGDKTRWSRVWLCGGEQRPGDFEAIGRVKAELVALLEAGGKHESKPGDNGDYVEARVLSIREVIAPTSIKRTARVQENRSWESVAVRRKWRRSEGTS